jgi:NAD(P)-dependent dehydrogenase (short-subunit alcohol dehydrogenase family)
LITGSSGSLGTVLSASVERELDAEVYRVDRNPVPDGVDGPYLQVDLNTGAGIDAVRDLIREWQPTVLVNCAAIDHSCFVANTDDERVDELIQVGLTTPYLLMAEMARLAVGRAEETWVVNIVSPYRLVGVRTHSLYCGAKAALSRAGESAAVETGREHKFNVVSVVPGAFQSNFRPVEPNDAWLVRWYRGVSRGPGDVGGELLRRLRLGAIAPHRTIRLGWDGRAFEWVMRVGSSDWFLVAVDQLIGQRAADGQAEVTSAERPSSAATPTATSVSRSAS